MTASCTWRPYDYQQSAPGDAGGCDRTWALRIVGETIVEVSERSLGGVGERIVDGEGLTALPGIIDMHGDMLEREAEPRPNTHFPLDLAIYELDKRLAACGVTTAYAALSFWQNDRPDSMRTEPMVRALIETLCQVRDTLLTECHIHARFEVTTPEIAPFLMEMLTTGEIRLISLMDHTPGQGQYRDVEKYVTSIAQWRGVDRSHIERELHERLSRKPNPADDWLLARDIATLAAEQGIPIASHDDDTLAKIDLVSSLGVSIAEFPVTLEAAQEARQRGMHIVMGAPNVLRGGSHSGNLNALAAVEAGLVDLLAADYAPVAMLQAVFIIVERGLLPLYEAAKLISQGPAEALGLHDRGRIEVGKRADLLLASTDGRPRVRATIRQGTPIYWDATMAGRA
ncbi:phosphonate metabolism protein PhnM [Candidatus Gracilibacteria bacterium]|nr:phosphonate metabolism protein PhnM [Candidatus Gracilibacteria bacterium]